MIKIRIKFYECAHEGDLFRYKKDMESCGAIVTGYELNQDSESGIIEGEVGNYKEFLDKFRDTDACDFSDFGDAYD